MWKTYVASSIPGVKDMINLSGGGMSVPPENPGELANAMTLIFDQKACNTMGEEGCKYVVENHIWDGVARKIFSICKILSDSTF